MARTLRGNNAKIVIFRLNRNAAADGSLYHNKQVAGID